MIAALSMLVRNGTIGIGCLRETFEGVNTCVNRGDQERLHNISSIVLSINSTHHGLSGASLGLH